MKFFSLLTGFTTVILFSACSNNSTGETIYVPKNDSTTVVSIPTDTSGVPVTNAPDITTPILTTQQPLQPTTVTGVGMNPEHGKPGHRCDLAVGAPLNSAAPIQQQPTGTITPTVANTSDISAKNATIVTSSKPAAAGMNPEHGKPGHRCDIAVGAPLDSKPAEAKIEQQPVTKTNAPPTPLLPTTTPGTSVPVAAGMNPEHGKPGHRCDIAVGDPLPKQ